MFGKTFGHGTPNKYNYASAAVSRDCTDAAGRIVRCRCCRHAMPNAIAVCCCCRCHHYARLIPSHFCFHYNFLWVWLFFPVSLLVLVLSSNFVVISGVEFVKCTQTSTHCISHSMFVCVHYIYIRVYVEI